MFRSRIFLSSAFFLLSMAASSVAADPDDQYQLGPDSQRQPGVPQGKVTRHLWKSNVFEGTLREYYLYAPAAEAQQGAEDYAVMVFQDGHAYVKEDGQFRVPIVFDNLIHQRKMPPVVGIFINPGHKPAADKPDDLPADAWKPNNRSFEYDTLSDQYARFLLEEMLPAAAKETGLKLTDDPDRRAICGISSGGICAWTVAWERPDAFRKVLSHVGSFTNIRGGHVYHALIRKTDNKPIRAFVQDGKHDLDNAHGNWWLANLEMDAALKFKGYDYQFVGGEGGHNGKHGGAILPESLAWLWRATQ